MWYTTSFTDRSVVTIESLRNHEDKLVNINPIDTFIDVTDEDEPIRDGTIIIMTKDKYEDLSEEEMLLIHGSTEPAVKAGMKIALVSGDEGNFKITLTDNFE